MQIVRVCPSLIRGAVKGFSISLKRSAFASSLALAGLSAPTLMPQATAAASIPVQSPNPDTSLTGWTLAGIVMMQRGDIGEAYRALAHMLPLSPHDLHLRVDTLHYAALSGQMNAALELARTLPADDLSTLLLAQDAIVHGNVLGLHHILDANNHQGAIMAAATPALLAWNDAAQGRPNSGITRLLDASFPPSIRGVYALHAALISESLSFPERTSALFQQATPSRVAPLGIQIAYAQLYAGWLARHDRKAEAIHTLDLLIRNSALRAHLVPALGKALERMPKPSLRNGMAVLDLQLGLTLANAATRDHVPSDMAIIVLRQALFMDPSLEIARIVVANLLAADTHNKEALDTLADIAPDSPFAGPASQERIKIAIGMQDLAQQAAALRQALIISPGDPEYLVQLGNIEGQLGHQDDAIASYTQALAASGPRKAQLWPILIGRAMAWQEKGDWSHTREDMMHALELAPNEPTVLNFVGYADIEHNTDTSHAVELLRRALALQPSDSSIRDSYAWALLKTRADLDHAMPFLIQAAEHAPDDPEISYHLGIAYWYLGRKLEAQDQWNQALSDNPHPVDRALIMQALQHGPHLASFERSK